MKLIILTVIAIPVLMVILNSCGKSEKEAEITTFEKKTGKKGDKTVKINSNESIVKWIGKKVTDRHNGTINILKGEIHLDGDKVSAGNLEIDMNTISINDLTGEDSLKLSNHLKSDDFFSVVKNPVSKFEITDLVPLNNAEKPDYNYTVKGNLTIKGISNGITFPASIKVENGSVISRAGFDIDRTKWDIRYGSGKFFENIGNKMIDDYFNIQFNIIAN